MRASTMKMSRMIAFALLALPVATVAAHAQITHVALTVAGTNDEWTTSTLLVSPGDIIIIRADGRVRVGQFLGEVGPAGTSSGDGALQYKVGTGAPQRAGAQALVTVAAAGELKFRVGDSRYDDNSGSFAVDVLVIPASAIPPASTKP